VGPYGTAAGLYWTAGWYGVLPLPWRQKSPPPDGWTGQGRPWPSYADLTAWCEERASGNIALRLPEHVLGIDVDDYDGRGGGDTLARLAGLYGPLPATWIVGSREDPTSGIRLYRVPPGLAWPGTLGPGIETIRTGHRYAVTWPSIHPDTGRTYTWRRPDGLTVLGEVPGVDTLPDLPDTWVAGITGGQAEHLHDRLSLDPTACGTWLSEHGAGTECRAVTVAADRAIADLHARTGARHDIGVRATIRLSLLAAEGHAGALPALRRLHAVWSPSVAADRGPDAARAEWGRMLDGAIELAAAKPASLRAAGDPCGLALYGGRPAARSTWAGPGVPLSAPGPPGAPQVPPGPPDGAAPTPEDAAAQAVERHLPLLDWQALWDDDSDEEWIVEPILPARRLVALYSPPKVGKSLLMLELAVAVARGVEVLGRMPDRPRRVLYVDFENDPKGDIRERLIAMDLTPKDLTDLCYLSFPTLGGLDSPAGAAELMAAVEHYRCEVVVIDTVSRAVLGEENDNDTWLNFYRHTGLALKQAGVAMIRLDHSGKDEGRGQRGGSAKVGDVDAVWKLERTTDTTFRLTCEAHRMPIAEREIILTRLTEPVLRHKVEGAGWMAEADAVVAAVIAAMDRAGLPAGAGRDKAAEVARAGGIKASKARLAAAVRCRKRIAGLPTEGA
jgi:hypothetical protein